MTRQDPAADLRPGDHYVQSFARGLAVIRSFSAAAPRQTLTEVAGRTGLTRAGARRILLTLQTLGYVESDGKLFALTPRILDLGFAYLSSMPMWNVAEPLMEALVEQVKESCSAAVLEGTDILYVLRVPTRKIMRNSLGIGSRLPAYCTSMGRVLLAALPEAEARERLGTAALPRRTEYTLTEPAAVLAALDRVRSDGYAVIDQEVEIGLRSIAVPLMTARRVTVAAVNLGLPARGEPVGALVERYLPALQDVQNRMREILR